MATEPVPNRSLDGRLRDQRRNEGVQACPMRTMDVPLNNAAQTNLFESDVLFEGVKFSTERVHSVTFFAPVCPPQLDETGKDLFGLLNSTFPPKPLDRGQGVEHEVRAEMEFQRFLAYDLSGTVNGLTLGGQRSMGVEPLMPLEPCRCLTSILLAVFG